VDKKNIKKRAVDVVGAWLGCRFLPGIPVSPVILVLVVAVESLLSTLRWF
jgi:hypothetical protein